MLTDDLVDPGRTATSHPAHPSRHRGEPARAASRLAERLLGGPLTVVLVLVGTVQVATWLPHYLTWPYWADHDVFATAARAWLDGALPYRDTFLNQFPATLYLFVVLGKTVGWGRPWGLYAFDA